jgi:hypothetical protein
MLALALAPFVRVQRISAVSTPTRAVRPAMCEKPTWGDAEDWALQDAVGAFTVGAGSEVSTFWSALAASTAELSARSAAECEERVRELEKAPRAGPQPAVLEDWQRLEDGRYTGRVAGESSFVWLSVSVEGRLASDPRPDVPGYIESVGMARQPTRAPLFAAVAGVRCHASERAASELPSPVRAPHDMARD